MKSQHAFHLPSELLKSLDGSSVNNTAKICSLEAVGVGGLSKGELEFVVGPDLGNLLLDRLVINGKLPEASKRLGGSIDIVLLDEETGSLGEKKHATDEDKSIQELDGDGDTVGSSVCVVLSSLVDAGSEKDTNGDSPLVDGDDGTTDPLGSTLRLVERDECRYETDTGTCENTTGREQLGRSVSNGKLLESIWVSQEER